MKERINPRTGASSNVRSKYCRFATLLLKSLEEINYKLPEKGGSFRFL